MVAFLIFILYYFVLFYFWRCNLKENRKKFHDWNICICILIANDNSLSILLDSSKFTISEYSINSLLVYFFSQITMNLYKPLSILETNPNKNLRITTIDANLNEYENS